MDVQKVIQAYTKQRRQKGIAKYKAQQSYRRQRGSAKIKSRKRYRVARNKPGFKRKQKIRKKKPWLYRRIQAVKEVSSGTTILPHDISFIHPDTGEVSIIRDVSQITGNIMYMTESNGFGTLPLERFFDEIVFLDFEDIENFYELFDNYYLTEGEEAEFDKSDALAEAEEVQAEKISAMVETLGGN